MAWAALVVSIASVLIASVFSIRFERWRRKAFAKEAVDRKEALALQRHAQEYDEGGWPRWGRTPGPRKSEE